MNNIKMSDLVIIIQNLGDYIECYLTLNQKQGSYVLSDIKDIQGVQGREIVSWEVSGLPKPTYENLSIYSEDNVYFDTIVIKKINDVDNMEYKEQRDKFKLWMNSNKNWDGLTSMERKFLCIKFLVENSVYISSFLTEDKQIKYFNICHQRMTECRETKWKKAVAYIYVAFGLIYGKIIIEYLYDSNMVGTYLDGTDRLENYLKNNEQYISSGFSSIPLVPLNDGYTRESVRTNLINILFMS